MIDWTKHLQVALDVPSGPVPDWHGARLAMKSRIAAFLESLSEDPEAQEPLAVAKAASHILAWLDVTE